MLEDVWNIELDSLPLHDDRYVKPKVRAYGDKIYTNFLKCARKWSRIWIFYR